MQQTTKEAAASFFRNHMVAILGALVGIVTFLCIYGVHILNVTYTDWLLGGGDLTQNYLGWCFFRNSGWAFPIGQMDQIVYPNEASVIFTDSVPLMAVFFKLFRGILPEQFQYFGLWGLLCFAVQGIFGSLLIHHYVKRTAESVVGSLFFIITPVMLVQISMHPALGAQWLILAAFWLGLRRRALGWKKSAAGWALLGVLAAGIQLYFIPICALILISFLLSDILRRFNYKSMLAGLISFLAAAVLMVALLGGFAHDHIPNASILGQASFNLNGLFNAQGWSQVIDTLPVYGAKAEEGLAFPGTGVLFVLAVGAVTWLIRLVYRAAVKKERRPFHSGSEKKENSAAYLILVAACVAVALSPIVTYDSAVVAQWEPPLWMEELWSRVGLCGRFIWPVVYLIILGSVVFMEKEMPWEAMTAVLLVAVAVFQVSDGKWQLMQRQVQFSTEYVYYSPLQDEKWEEWAQDGNMKHMVFVSYMVDDVDLINDLSAYAAQNHMSVNDFGSACQTMRLEAAEDLLPILTDVQEDTLYIYKESDRAMCVNPDMEYTEVDGLIVGTAK